MEKTKKYISKFNELSDIKAVIIGEIIEKDKFEIYV